LANPQKENGHIDIANEIAEHLAKTNLSAYESRVLWAIWRKTWGWHKKEDWITLEQLHKITGLNKGHLSRTLHKLFNRNILYQREDKGKLLLGFQKDYELWDANVIHGIDWDQDARPWYFKLGEPTKPDVEICEWCKKEFPADEMQTHYIIPKSWGGPDNKKNWIFVCKSCHEQLHKIFTRQFGKGPLKVPLQELNLYYKWVTLEIVKGTKYNKSSYRGVPLQEFLKRQRRVPIQVKKSSSTGTFQRPKLRTDKDKRVPKETITKETITKENNTTVRSKKNAPHQKKEKKKKINFNFDKEEWENITPKDIERWKEAYPACDIKVELAQMREWLISNPKKAKKNYRKFITNWLSRSQDKGGTKTKKKSFIDMELERLRKEKEAKNDV